ncbi:hypothetical protein ACPCSP_25460 [Streptomyces cinereoruber]|uniref:hypothetical protein n=1 Tax=Streptomyces cinereoruber TaxID=67260 RepID=UPI003C300887
MSNDNVAVLTTLNAAVLLVGTVQYSRLLSRALQHPNAFFVKRIEQERRILEKLRQGINPTSEEIRALQKLPTPWDYLKGTFESLLKKSGTFIVGVVWLLICAAVLTSQVAMLRWIGTDSPGPQPKLAKVSFLITTTSMILLVIEGYFAAAFRGARSITEYFTAQRSRYSPQEIQLLDTLRRTGSTTQPNPSSTP